MEACRQDREAAYVIKPVTSSDLFDVVVAELGGRSSQRKSSPSPGDGGSQAPFAGVRVLVVEDNPVNQMVATGMLESAGVVAEVAENGRKALEALDHTSSPTGEDGDRPIDLVLMDCQMPEMDGFEATRRIREQEASAGRSRLPIVALTANALEGDRQRCLDAGMDDYMAKPFSQADLLNALRRWVPVGAEGESATKVAVEGEAPVAGIVNQETLDALRALKQPGGDSVLARIIGVYLDSTPTLIQTLRDAVANKDADSLRSAAHSLKSSSANLGADRLADICRNLEMLGRESRTADAPPLMQEIERLQPQVCQALEAELQRETA